MEKEELNNGLCISGIKNLFYLDMRKDLEACILKIKNDSLSIDKNALKSKIIAIIGIYIVHLF